MIGFIWVCIGAISFIVVCQIEYESFWQLLVRKESTWDGVDTQ